MPKYKITKEVSTVAKIQRIRTGIKGFDELVQGGLPIASTTLLCGTPGTGKSIFGLEYVYNGARKFGDKCLYVSFEQSEEEMRSQAELLGMDLSALEKKKKLELWHIPPTELDQDTAEKIIAKVTREKFKRLVVDSVSTLSINAPIYESTKDISLVDVMKERSFFSPPIIGDMIIKRFIYNFVNDLKNVDHCTTILISEAAEKGEYISRDTISEFICDGVILMKFESMIGDFSRNILVRKMRHTNNDENVHPLEISNRGIIVHRIEQE